jgi:hypothetical protein
MRLLSLTVIALSAAALVWTECSQCQDAKSTEPATQIVSSISRDNVALSGIWVSNCYLLDPSQFSQDTYTFSATGGFSLEVNRFADNQCQSFKSGSNFYGTYLLNEKVDTMDGEKAIKARITLDNADWPEGIASQVDWLLQLDGEKLRFGTFNPPFNWINNAVIYQKIKGQGPMVF